MKEKKELSDPINLRNQILQHLFQFKRNSKVAGYSDDLVNDALYAMVSLIDETVLSIPGDCRCYWLSKPLQLDLFNNIIAGEEFYSRLDKLLSSPQINADILKVYYLCLALGFEGKYKIYNYQDKQKIIRKLGSFFSDPDRIDGFHIHVENHNRIMNKREDRIRKVLFFLVLTFGVILTFEIIAFKILITIKENEILNQLKLMAHRAF
jgi:type IV/VI secretion system ImpK/VasF family protein